MIESDPSDLGADAAGDAIVQSAGASLKRAREASGMHIGTLAVTLKVPVKKLEALESDQWDLLPDAVFARALAASVCRALKMDSASVLAQLPTVAPNLNPNRSGINEPFRGASTPATGSSVTALLSRPLGLAVLALALGALALVFWPERQEAPAAAMTDGARASNHSGTMLPPPSSQVDSKSMDVPPNPGSSPNAGDVMIAGASSAPGSSSSFSVVPRASMETPADLPPSVSEMQSNLVPVNVAFKTTGPSWIQVTDGKGATGLKKLMGAGESVTVSGPLPLSVLVGRVDVTTVEINGKPFDMTPVARENIARFEVKQ